MPWAASFAFNNANELALPLDNRTNDIDLAAEWSFTDGIVRVAWDGSWFNNRSTTSCGTTRSSADGLQQRPGAARSVRTIRAATATATARRMGRMALAPDNSMNVISAMGLYQDAGAQHVQRPGVVHGHEAERLADSVDEQPGDQPAVGVTRLPRAGELPRNTAEAEVQGLNALFNFNTRPNKHFAFAMRYRYNNHNNETPAFDAVEYVRFDAVPEETGGETEQFDIIRRTLDANATSTVLPSTALKMGYGYDAFNRSGRSFSDMTDDILPHDSVDTMQVQWMHRPRRRTEHIVRTGSGFSRGRDGRRRTPSRASASTTRRIATRDRGSVAADLHARLSNMDFNVSWTRRRKDVYSGEGHEFGLMDNDNQTRSTSGSTYTPKSTIGVGLQLRPRHVQGVPDVAQSNPSCTLNVPPCPPGTYDTWTDPNRNWSLKNDETVNNFNFYFDMNSGVEEHRHPLHV